MCGVLVLNDTDMIIQMINAGEPVIRDVFLMDKGFVRGRKNHLHNGTRIRLGYSCFDQKAR